MKIDYTAIGESGYRLHPTQKEILIYIINEGQASPNTFSVATNTKLGTASYHFKVMRERGWLRIADEIPRRGAMEHFHVFAEDAPVEEELAA